jgi:hypothetical protein
MASKIIKHPCSVCSKSVRENQKGLYCDSCCSWLHLKCTKFTNLDYLDLQADHSDWFCSACIAQMFPFGNIEDDFEYECCLFCHNYCNNLSTAFIKNSPQLKLTKKTRLCNNDIDPDKFFYNQFDNLGNNYYLENEFNDLMVNLPTDFSLLRINARSLINKLDNVVTYLNSLNHIFSIIAVTETWANTDNQNILKIPGYNRLEKKRTSGQGGGVALFIHHSLNYIERNDLNVFGNVNLELLFVELIVPGLSNKVVGVIYRPPDSNL